MRSSGKHTYVAHEERHCIIAIKCTLLFGHTSYGASPHNIMLRAHTMSERWYIYLVHIVKHMDKRQMSVSCFSQGPCLESVCYGFLA